VAGGGHTLEPAAAATEGASEWRPARGTERLECVLFVCHMGEIG
jgi:hypothetical protein